jgi:hypothetical protein
MQDFNFNTNVPPQQPIRARMDNSRIWFAAAVPVLGLFVEWYAYSFKLGVLVWVTAFIAIIAACYADRKYLAGCGYSVDRLNFTDMVFAPIYIRKRCVLSNESSVPAIVLVFTFIYALMFNGFTSGLTMSTDDMISHVRDNYVQNMSQCSSYDGYNMIGEQLEGIADGDIEWSAERADGEITVTAEAENFTVVFTVPFDGFAYGDIEVTECVIDGKEYSGDKLKSKVSAIFTESADETTDSVPQSENNSYTEA